MLLILVVIVVAAVLLVVRPKLGFGSAAAPSGGVPASVPATAGPSSTAKPTKAASADGKPCTKSQVRVKALTDRSTYGSGQYPKLQFSIENTGTNTCVLDVGTAEQVYTITSGSERYWVSTDCQKKPDHRDVLLLPGKTVKSAPLVWHRTRSSKATCGEKLPPVPAGGAAYHFAVTIAGIPSEGYKQFLLR